MLESPHPQSGSGRHTLEIIFTQVNVPDFNTQSVDCLEYLVHVINNQSVAALNPILYPLLAIYRGGAANFGFISITYHQYIFGLYKYILRLEISIFDRENAKNCPKFRMIMCFWDIQSGGGISTNVGYREIFSFSNILISPIDILIVSYDVKTC